MHGMNYILPTASSAKFYSDGTLLDTITTNIPTVSTLGAQFRQGNFTNPSVTYIDWVFIRQYLATEPAWESWGSEQLINDTLGDILCQSDYSTAWAVLSRLKHLMKPATPLFRALPPIIIADKPINSSVSQSVTPYVSPYGNYRKQNHSCRPISGPLTNYQLKLTVHKGSGTDIGADVYLGTNVKDDFSDIVFPE